MPRSKALLPIERGKPTPAARRLRSTDTGVSSTPTTPVEGGTYPIKENNDDFAAPPTGPAPPGGQENDKNRNVRASSSFANKKAPRGGKPTPAGQDKDLTALTAASRFRKDAPTAECSPSKRLKLTGPPSSVVAVNKKASTKTTQKGNKVVKKANELDFIHYPVLDPPGRDEEWLLPSWETPPIMFQVDAQRMNSSAQKSRARKDLGDVVEIVNFPVYRPKTEYGENFLKGLTIFDPLMEKCIPNSNILLHRCDNVPAQKRLGRGYYNYFYYNFWWDQSTLSTGGPDRKKIWIVWDHYTGLVRMTDMFFCCRPGKGEPNIAISKTPELKDLCANVTGGRLDLQGYWVPYHAARVIAARLCWDIRFQLTPIFGPMFPYQCVAPYMADYHNFYVDDYTMRRVKKISHSLEVEAGSSIEHLYKEDSFEPQAEDVTMAEASPSPSACASTVDEEVNVEMVFNGAPRDGDNQTSSSPLAVLSKSSNTSYRNSVEVQEKVEKPVVKVVEKVGRKVAVLPLVNPVIEELKKNEELYPLAQNRGKYQESIAGVLFQSEVAQYDKVASEYREKAEGAVALLAFCRLGNRGLTR